MRSSVRFFACLTAMTTIIASACGEGPTILSGYRSSYGVTGGPRGRLHNGVDFAGAFGAPVLAAAEGTVTRAGSIGPRCGDGVIINHAFGLRTWYCHLSTVDVVPGEKVKRGQTIGAIGKTGDYGGVTHVHFMVGSNGEYDPMNYIVGCYDPSVEYPKDKIVMTYPVVCRDR
jgi:murein DD-endopeptidase MepM/ murein hydrolase activator NlpD